MSRDATAVAGTLGSTWAGDAATDVRVCYVDPEPARQSHVRDALKRRDRLVVETAGTPAAALAHLESFDCLVLDHGPDERDALSLVRSVREVDLRLPVVLRTTDAATVDASVLDRWTDVVRTRATDADAAPGRLAGRVCRLVDHRRLVGHARRTRAGLDLGDDPTVLTGPDGRVDFVDAAAVRLTGHEPSAIVGRDWRTLFEEATVDRLEADALPSVDDGWRWTGTCTLSRPDGDRVAANTRVVGLDGDGLVFAFDAADGA